MVRGGYEQWCQEVGQALSERGHEVSVITSRAEVEGNGGLPVYRVLELEVTGGLRSTIARLLRRKHLEAASLSSVERIVNDIRPDATLIWGMWNVPRSVPALIERLLPEQTAYYLCDYWPALPSAFVQQLQAPARRKAAALPKRLAALLLSWKAPRTRPLELRHPICVSQAVRRLLVEAGIPVDRAKVIYGGTDVQPLKARQTGAAVKLLFLGRLTPDKGLHTAVEALHLLAARALAVRLDVYGEGDPEYLRKVSKAIEKHKLSSTVRFLGSASRAQLPALFPQYDSLVFPSQWDEPFARTVLEAMAANLLVIGTTTGGTGEILKHGETGLTFEAGDAVGLADQIESVARDRVRFRRFAEAGRNAVVRQFTLKRMVDQIEEALGSISNSTRTPARLVKI